MVKGWSDSIRSFSIRTRTRKACFMKSSKGPLSSSMSSGRTKRTWSGSYSESLVRSKRNFCLVISFSSRNLKKAFSTISSCIPYSRIESRSSSMCESCLGSMIPSSSKSQCMSLLTVCTHHMLSLSKLMVHHSSFGVAVAMVMIGCRSVRLLFFK